MTYVVIHMEMFTKELYLLTYENDFHFYPCAKIRLTRLAFVDDLLLFARGGDTST